MITDTEKTEIQKIVDQLLQQDYHRIQLFIYNKKKYWLKQVEHPTGTMRVVKHHPQQALQNEIAVLRHLNKKNAPVSKLVLWGHDYLVLEDVGKTINELVNHNEGNQVKLEEIVLLCSQALAKLHNMNLFHGRPAIRDMAWDGKQVRFIDFESKSGRKSLQFNQERDLLIFLHALYRNKNLNQKMVESAVQQYRKNDGEQIWQKSIARVWRWRFLYYIARLFKPIAKKDLIAGLKLCEYLLRQYKIEVKK